jgi:hypothetical protein
MRAKPAVSDSEKAEVLADKLEADFQPVDHPSDMAFIETVDKAMCACQYTPASEPTSSGLSEVLQAIKGINVGRSLGLSVIPNRVFRHLPKSAITFHTKVFKTVFLRQYFAPACTHAVVVPILLPDKDPRFSLPTDP